MIVGVRQEACLRNLHYKGPYRHGNRWTYNCTTDFSGTEKVLRRLAELGLAVHTKELTNSEWLPVDDRFDLSYEGALILHDLLTGVTQPARV